MVRKDSDFKDDQDTGSLRAIRFPGCSKRWLRGFCLADVRPVVFREKGFVPRALSQYSAAAGFMNGLSSG